MAVPMKMIRRGALAVAMLFVLGFGIGALVDGSTQSDVGLTGIGELPRDAQFDDGAAARGVAAEAPDSARVADEVLAQEAGSGESTFGDRVIKTTNLTIEVERGEFERAWNRVMQLKDQVEGEVMSSNRGRGDGPIIVEDAEARTPAFGTITLRVPAQRLDEAVSLFRGSIGDVRAENTSSQDVSEEFVDLQARLRNLRAEKSVLLDLFARARSIRDTLTVRERLSEVQGEIERVTGRIRFIESRTEFSTLTVNLSEPGAVFSPLEEEGPSFARAWETAVEGLVRMATASMIGVLWLGPFALLALAVYAALRRRVQRPAPQA